jgi:hypothetical protein
MSGYSVGAAEEDRMSPDRPLAVTGKASAQDLSTVPDRPQIEPREMSTGGPVVLGMQSAEATWKHTLGWEERSERRGGRCFLIVKATFTGSFRIVARFPMTNTGWAQAWKTLVELDRDGAAKALEALADRESAAARKAELAEVIAQSIGVLADARYIPGSGELPDIASGSRVDIRFLADRLVFVSQATVPRVLAGFGYPDVETVEVGGPGRIQRFTAGQQMALGMAFGPETEILPSMTTILPRVTTRIKTVVRFQTTRCELFAVVTHIEPDVLRMQLSPALWAIREAREPAAQPGAGGGQTTEDGEAQDRADEPGSIVDQLAKLAGLLESGLLTREEFDRLKAGLLGGP